jgi:hypothetical protein
MRLADKPLIPILSLGRNPIAGSVIRLVADDEEALVIRQKVFTDIDPSMSIFWHKWQRF